MKLVVIDLEWLEKQIHQQETVIGMSKDRMGREAASAISNTLQRVRSAASPIESHIDAAYKEGFKQCLINKLKEKAGEAREFQEDSLKTFKKENGYET